MKNLRLTSYMIILAFGLVFLFANFGCEKPNQEKDGNALFQVGDTIQLLYILPEDNSLPSGLKRPFFTVEEIRKDWVLLRDADNIRFGFDYEKREDEATFWYNIKTITAFRFVSKACGEMIPTYDGTQRDTSGRCRFDFQKKMADRK
jgi:hypothetical protein